jgi:hypothetical protein
MVDAALGNLRLRRNIINRGALISLVIEAMQRCFKNFFLADIRRFLCCHHLYAVNIIKQCYALPHPLTEEHNALFLPAG